MKIGLLGYGKMGKMVEKMAVSHEIVPIEEADVLIDFSAAEAVLGHIQLALSRRIPIVIGTTGWDDRIEDAKKLVAQENGSLLYSPNFSIGMALFIELSRRLNEIIKPFKEFDLVGIESHHREKKDAPSGTSKAISKAFDGGCDFTSIRVGHQNGTHTLLLDSYSDTLTLSHVAKNREGFAKGAILAAEWLIEKKGWFTFDDVIRSLYSTYHAI